MWEFERNHKKSHQQYGNFGIFWSSVPFKLTELGQKLIFFREKSWYSGMQYTGEKNLSCLLASVMLAHVCYVIDPSVWMVVHLGGTLFNHASVYNCRRT